VEEIPEVSYAQFLSEIGVESRRIPIDGILETTFRCNLNCVHCYVNEPASSREVRERELPLPRLLRVVDEIAEAGCLNLLLTGGEVLLRPDFKDLYVYILRRGIRVTIFTNGTLVTDEAEPGAGRGPGPRGSPAQGPTRGDLRRGPEARERRGRRGIRLQLRSGPE
jgi:hypothetical protein